ncbi:efflux RND transporter periplasmic adaptor subunit [Aestuariivita sp.]|jgi:RND family efflux transporter MFP subunit|uniref:efflux RND transporter periplasmic adaptor subunit n=1 Tax=Aestuariivita sp. TaxID=1872407 RepID=UPI0021736CD5|nr:efflux RND transporter periplasmic adaptor subunit [Aestuariivita sp.]MCE8006974.1 efflux RND transporter periplasmic adaptor subunit [Aestuariivita sp.]
MLGPYDYALIVGLFLLCLLGLRGGIVVTSLLAAGLLGCVVLALSVGTADSALALVGIWFVTAFTVVVLWRRLRGTTVSAGSGFAALLVSTGEFAVIAVFVTGALLSRLPEEATLVRSAAAYPMIAEAGSRLTSLPGTGVRQPAVMLSYPEPVLPETEPRETNRDARPIDWAEVTTFDNRITRILTGGIVAADRAPVSFEVGGTVSQVHVEMGQHFDRGDILADLDPTPLQLALDERRAALIEAKAIAHEANLTFERQQQLQQSGAVSQAALDRAQAAAESAKSRLDMTLAAIRSAEDRLNDAVLRAPFDGVVAARLIEPAQAVQPGVPVFEIQNEAAGFQIELVVPETLIGEIEADTEHRAIMLDGADSPVIARVHEIGSRANATTGFPVTLDIVAQTKPVRAGMTVEVHLSLPMQPNREADIGLAAIPYTSISPADGDGHVAFVFDEATGTLERREIMVVGREGTVSLVSDGLERGEIVATRGLPFLRDGMPVALRGVGIARYDD